MSVDCNYGRLSQTPSPPLLIPPSPSPNHPLSLNLIHQNHNFLHLTSEMVDQKTFSALKKGNRRAQKVLYDDLSPQMFAVCRRYIANAQDAEDIMIKGFFNAFTKLDQLDDPEALAAWMRRIMVNECLMYHRRNKKFKSTLELHLAQSVVWKDDVLDQLTAQEIFSYIDELPDGYRNVFNLYCIEGYKHREIAEMLNISINTSKSQLILARKRLKARIEVNNKTKKSNEQ